MKNTTQTDSTSYEFVVDNIPYRVDVVPEDFNDDTRFRIYINGDEGHLYAWDRETVSLRALDDDAATLPDGLDRQISDLIVRTILM